MKIRDVSFEKFFSPIKTPYSIAYKTISSVQLFIVRIHLDNGIVGLGSASPGECVTGETVEICEAALKTAYTAFIGEDIRHLFLHCHTLSTSIPHAPAARAAIDMALFDAATQYWGLSVVQFLGQKHEGLPTSVTIGIKDISSTVEDALAFIKNGFLILKIKLGISLEEDIARLSILREKIPPHILIRVDPNQGYSAQDLCDFVKRTQKLNLEFIEQPLPANQTEDMRALPPEIKHHLAADESFVNERDAFNLCAPEPACQILNIKLMKCGGIWPSQRIATVAECAQKDLMWGCMDESCISISAALHSALACSNTKYLDLDGSFELLKDPASCGFILKEGILYPTSSPGLGLITNSRIFILN